MNFAPPPRRCAPAENFVPMINVVFLLLIFFLMSAQITRPPPIDLARPDSASPKVPEGSTTLFVASDGTAYFNGLQGPAALIAIAQLQPEDLRIEADRSSDASQFASLLARLRTAGIGDIDLVTQAP